MAIVRQQEIKIIKFKYVVPWYYAMGWSGHIITFLFKTLFWWTYFRGAFIMGWWLTIGRHFAFQKCLSLYLEWILRWKILGAYKKKWVPWWCGRGLVIERIFVSEIGGLTVLLEFYGNSVLALTTIALLLLLKAFELSKLCYISSDIPTNTK